ncbi:MAG: hypothetical protein ACREIM_02260 [Nitrospiraceae bacterium]
MEGPLGWSIGNRFISSIGQAELFSGGWRHHSPSPLGIPIRQLHDGAGMDLKILKVFFEQVQGVSIPPIVGWAVEPFDSKAPIR